MSTSDETAPRGAGDAAGGSDAGPTAAPSGDAAGLPHGLALAWGLVPEPQRGPKRELSVARIVEAAIGLADEAGLAAVSMSAVAAALGFTPMSLYRYVSAKEDLLLLMGDIAVGEPPAVLEGRTWQEAARAWVEATLGVYRAHPWLLDMVITGAPTTPHNLAWLERLLLALESSGLDPVHRLAVAQELTGMARWQAIVERSYAGSAEDAGLDPVALEQREEQTMSLLADPERFPALARVTAAGALTAPEDPFAFALERFLDGLTAFAAREAR